MRPSNPPAAVSARSAALDVPAPASPRLSRKAAEDEASATSSESRTPPTAKSPEPALEMAEKKAEQPPASDPDHGHDHEDLRHDFFERGDRGHHGHDEPSLVDIVLHRPLTPGARQAMLATIAMVAVSTLLIGGYLIYHKLLMPTPVELGAGGPPIGFNAMPPISAAPPAPAGQALVARPLAPKDAVSSPPGANGVSDPGKPASADAVGEQGADNPIVGAAAPADAVVTGMPTAKTVEGADIAAAPEAASGRADSPSGEVEAAAADGALTPAMAEAYAHLLLEGGNLQRAGKPVEAQAAFERALVIVPTGSGAMSKLALLHLDAGRRGEAQGYAQRAADLDPSNAEAWIVLGSILQAANDSSGAQAAYAKCAALEDPQYSLECKRLSQ